MYNNSDNSNYLELKQGLNLISWVKTSYDYHDYYYKEFEINHIADDFDEFANKVEELSDIYNDYKNRNGFFAYSFNFFLKSYYQKPKLNSIIKPADFPKLLLSKKNMINNVARYFEKEKCQVYKNIYVCDRKTVIKKDLMVVSSNEIIYCNIFDEYTIYPYLQTYDQLIALLNDEDNDTLLYNIINSLKITQNLIDIVSTNSDRNIKLSNMIILKNGDSIILELDSDENILILVEDLQSSDNLMDYKETISKIYLSYPNNNFFKFTANTLKYFSLLYEENKQRIERQNCYL